MLRKFTDSSSQVASKSPNTPEKSDPQGGKLMPSLLHSAVAAQKLPDNRAAKSGRPASTLGSGKDGSAVARDAGQAQAKRVSSPKKKTKLAASVRDQPNAAAMATLFDPAGPVAVRLRQLPAQSLALVDAKGSGGPPAVPAMMSSKSQVGSSTASFTGGKVAKGAQAPHLFTSSHNGLKKSTIRDGSGSSSLESGAGVPPPNTPASPTVTLIPPSKNATLASVNQKHLLVHLEGAGPSSSAVNSNDVTNLLSVVSTSTQGGKASMGVPSRQIINWDPQSQFSQALNQHVLMMLGDRRQAALLTLDPPSLGHLQVHLTTNQQTITAVFVSAHPDVRHALQAAFPSLNHALSQHGLQLADASVADPGAGGAGSQSRWSSAALAQSKLPFTANAEPDLVTQAVRLRGMVNFYV